ARANRGYDMNSSQFFIVATTLALADEPQHLNFNHTIFGQLISGFDIFTDLMGTPVNNSQTGTPLSPVTIVTASVISDNHDAVLRISAPPTLQGDSTIAV